MSALWPLLPFLGLWVMVCLGLADHWKMNPQYHYGWFVPALALFAGYGRWETRPLPSRPGRSGLWLVIIASLLLPPIWVFVQPNPDWPLVNWFFVTQVAVISLGTIGMLGGARWIKHFFAPIGLMFVSIPWPDQIESPVMQGLMWLAAFVATTGLELLGVAAVQNGNLIEVASGVVGVNEACSGIRSLQGSLMVSLVLGEIFRFSVSRRLLLVLISLVVAFVTNVFRVGFLAWSASETGLIAVDRWHDPAGLTTLGACIAAIYAIGTYLNRDAAPLIVLAKPPVMHPIPSWLPGGLTVLIALTLIGTELWYYDGDQPPRKPWSVTLPTGSERVQIPDSARPYLRYDDAVGAQWLLPNGSRCLLYFFDWKYGPAFSRVAAQLHRPDVCLPASGYVLENDRGKRTFTSNGVSLPFHSYIFSTGKDRLFVYHGVWQFRSARGTAHGPLAESKHRASFQSVSWRERKIGQQVAELLIKGPATPEEADLALERLLSEILSPNTDSDTL